ncbi:TonB-dependent receptor [Methylomonas sp. AM2-LC]|uniref:TonB-dependent receptor n=1 Tax=Methylomonas sp. AM2-LC TaxID=3153301 RepID=UPI00326400A1
MDFKRKLLYLAVSTALLPSTMVLAADTVAGTGNSEPTVSSESDAVNTLDTVKVSAVSVGRGSNVEKMDISTTVISRQQIQESAELTLDQILNRQMGIFTSNTLPGQTDPTGATVQMRGFGASGEKVLVTVDGVPINDGFFRTIDWNQVPKDTIEKIEIIRGGGGAAMWGNLAEGGVINIITREPIKDEKRAGAAYGSFNTVAGDLAGTLYHSSDVKVGANFNAISSDGYNMTPNAYHVTPNISATVNSTNNGLISAYFTPNDYSKYFVKFLASEQLMDKGAGGFALGNNQWYKYDFRSGGEIKYSKTGSMNFNAYYNHSEQDRMNGALIQPNGSGLTISGVANDPNQSYLTLLANSKAYAQQIESQQYQTYGAAAFIQEQFHGNWGDAKDVKVGFDARGINIDDTMQVNAAVSSSTSSTLNPGSFLANGSTYKYANINTSASNAFEGIFAQATFSPKDIPLDVTVGLRDDFWQAFDAYGTTSLYKTNGTFNKPTFANKTPSQGFYQFNPRLGLKYMFDSGVDLRGAIYRNFAAPGMNNLYRTYYGSNAAYEANASLNPETNFGQEIGIDFTNDTVKTKFTAYHNELSNFINSVTLCNTGATCTAGGANSYVNQFNLSSNTTSIGWNQNIGTATMEGGEFSVDWQATPTFDINAGVNRTWAYMNSFTGQFAALNAASAAGNHGVAAYYLNRQIPNVQPWTLNLGGKWDFYPDFSVSWTIKSWPAYWTNTQAIPGSNQQNTAATTADMHFNYKANKRLDLYINAQNLSNASYITTNSNGTSSIPTMGMPRNIMGGFKFSW